MTEDEKRTLCVDIDETLCSRVESGDYSKAEPLAGAQDTIRRLRDSGWLIVLHTARHFNNWKTTVEWLDAHGFGYDQIVFGKPPGRYYIDDRAIPFDGDWESIYERVGKLEGRISNSR